MQAHRDGRPFISRKALLGEAPAKIPGRKPGFLQWSRAKRNPALIGSQIIFYFHPGAGWSRGYGSLVRNSVADFAHLGIITKRSRGFLEELIRRQSLPLFLQPRDFG